MIQTSDLPCSICGEPAVVSLVDAHRIKPVLAQIANGKVAAFARHRPVEQHCFCKKHLRPPRFYGLDGKLLKPQITRS